MQPGRAVEVIAHIVFTRPDQLDGRPGLHRYQAGLGDVIIGKAAAEAPANPGNLDVHVLRLEPGYGDSRPGCARGQLRRCDDVSGFFGDMRKTVLRFERLMRDERDLVAPRDDRLCRCYRCAIVAIVENDLALTLQHGRVLLPEFFGAVLRVGARIPLHREGFSPLHRRPGRIGDDGYAVRQNEVRRARLRSFDRENIDNTVDLQCRFGIE